MIVLTLILVQLAHAGDDATDYSDKAIACLSENPADEYAAQACMKKVVESDSGNSVSWVGKVLSRDMVVGAEASGWGTYAVIADDRAARTLFLQFPRGSDAFSRIMDTSSGFGPKGMTFFRATGTFGGYRIAPSWACGGNRKCYVPIIRVTDPSKFENLR